MSIMHVSDFIGNDYHLQQGSHQQFQIHFQYALIFFQFS